jgi:hypothetical protein
MPAILDIDTNNEWRGKDNRNTKGLMEKLTKATAIDFKFRPLYKQVNSVQVNDLSDIMPISTFSVY